MGIKPDQLSIRTLFEQKHTFAVPKYQRGYAWDDQAVSDFIHDIARCLAKRKEGGKLNHFFGGIVTVPSALGNSSRSNYEVIDGQQRLASFVLLIGALVAQMRNALGDLTKKAKPSEEETKASAFLTNTVDALSKLYLHYRDSIALEYVEVPKLTLSDADRDFFIGLLEGKSPTSSRASHDRLQTAWDLLTSFVKTTFLSEGLAKNAEHIQLLADRVLGEDCTVIFMSSDTRSEAYQIFQVLNDRGVQLTDSDLLRAATMELLDATPLASSQGGLASAWDEVLAYEPKVIDTYLKWYYSSHEGKRPSSSELTDQFLEYRFKVTAGTKVTKALANSIVDEVERMDAAFELLDKMGDGAWPFSKDKSTVRWDRERLSMLVTHLKHSNAMPLLLALHELGSIKFAEAVASLERFVFRYKTIGNAHISPMTDLYLRHAKRIRDNPAGYKLSTLRTELGDLLDKMVPLDVFEASLRQLRYNKRAGNGHIRYLLITLEDHRSWFEKGANGVPRCKDKSAILDFSNTTLEHIYPRSAKASDKIAAMEPLKDALGNLAIFGPDDNDALANKPFAEKKKMLAKSNVSLNREVGQLADWTKATFEARANRLVQMALKIFVP
ncbi:DUF262 domain-containing protein [Sphingobium lignivorans]|uniref:DUF262 domain-containing protein n=1 Tax=Sphingobium lignivorans TaxID=2735886 RepID=A0ABR6NKR9_9SPHN|nr:DUF262 domain-containing protein [Sphingobium lignivorans]MBB5987870.1 hypothetical protein [Sphingobium lignivorans]